jgi:hypothetical protein
MTPEEAAAAYEALGRWVVREFTSFEWWGDVDGGWLQDEAIRLGLLTTKDRGNNEFERNYVIAEGAEP